MNRIVSGLGVALALGVAVSASVLADQSTSSDKPKWHEGRGGGFRELNLTDGQKSQMKALHEQQHDAMKNSMKALMDARQSLRAQIFSDNPDNAQIEALKAKIGGLEKDALNARVDLERKVAAILTPEQRKTMAAMQPGRGWGGHHRHHHHGGDGGDGGPDGSDGPPPAQP